MCFYFRLKNSANGRVIADEKKETPESIDKTTDTDENPLDLRGDTALLQNSDVSESKDIENSGDKKEGGDFRGKVKERLEAVSSIEKERESALDEIWAMEKDTDEARRRLMKDMTS